MTAARDARLGRVVTGARSTLRLFLLGRFAVEYAGEPVPAAAWRRRRPVHLVTALALAPGHVLHREELIDRLWPNKDLDAGANNLYRALHDLRQVTGDDAVTVERGAVRLHETTWVDVDAFEAAVAASATETILSGLELYRGDLLPDDPYDDAIGPRREGLRQRYVDAALRIGRADEVDPDVRIGVLRRLVDLDPTLEEGHRLLMTSLAAVGRPRDAARQYAACVQALRAHLDQGPSAATRALHGQLERAAQPAAQPAPARDDSWRHVARRLLGTDHPRPVRGRARALAEARAFAEAGRGALLIVGEAGAGKTRLAVEAARLLAEGSAVILAGLGSDVAGAAPYTPFVDAWTDLLRVQPGATSPFASFGPTPGGSAQDDRLRLFRAVEQSLAELAGGGTVCVLIEDLHEADESSLHLFHHLARAARHLPLALVGTLRAEGLRGGHPLQALVASLGRERTTARITLERLDRDATRALLCDLWGHDPDPDELQSIYGLGGGNPFYTEELAAAVRDGADPAASKDLRLTMRQRVARLGPDADRLLVAAAIQGVRFDFDVARRASAMEIAPALDALDLALSARLLEEQDGRYRFRHALLREALVDSLTHARRVYLHRMTAAALEAGDTPERQPELLAYHHQQAGDLEQALRHTLSAIDLARARLGFGEAVTHSERALELMDDLGTPPGEQRFAVLHDLGAMRVALGDLDAAVTTLQRAAALGGGASGWQPPPARRSSALRLAGLALIEAGNLAEAERCLDAALDALGEQDAPAELGNVYYHYAQLRWHQSRHAEAFELAERCLAVAEATGEVAAIARGYEMLALACHSLGEWKQGRAFEVRRTEVADGTLDVASAFDVHL
jgi:DNA-binding SARP family transcriptional activator/tetratricopeptide (TPR) repeat protein